MWEHIGTIATVAGFILTAVINIVTVTTYISRMSLEIQATVNAKLEGVEKEFEARLDLISREVGGTIQSLRTHVHGLEIWVRDTFARRDSFNSVRDELKADIKAVGDDLKAQINRLTDKLDSKPPGK